MSFILAIQGAASQGILWGIMALGVYITFRLLDFADLTVDGSFATGGAVCAVAIVNGINPILAVLLAIIAGFVAGAITGLLHTKCQIPAILAGILTESAFIQLIYESWEKVIHLYFKVILSSKVYQILSIYHKHGLL